MLRTPSFRPDFNERDNAAKVKSGYACDKSEVRIIFMEYENVIWHLERVWKEERKKK